MTRVGRVCGRRGVLGDRGGSALTTVIIVPVILMLFGLMIGVGRVALAEGDADAAARDAARVASLAEDPGGGQAQAQEAARTSLANSGVRCSQIEVSIDASALTAGVGAFGQVSATVSCTVPLSDLAIPGIGGSKTLTSTQSAPVDTWSVRAQHHSPGRMTGLNGTGRGGEGL
ncbi:pilus assembly protein (plasmid) [Streptomyces sp. NBC_00053]|uniref:TadE/TadG family type IV pilus assembly protein n=1 Tax=unclassified Streptomyces TaxID=2593676 RepID=UPI002251626B|nr:MULTISPECIES: TadE/TadG family type IV pilus assembly protein [unclassified Streptomyces]MCX4399959.1 pilus assembly protein [Streptomyces sp. NBC_01767]MCX5506037.1 pilus assembly protein [Streptomyces sp. NBC_00052]MCX5554308.1 pilus assembly protein [Streptomyces sp. NBC_00051]WSP52940.1 pilus assembly protein [Streptomyces sp. NBC_01243]